MKSRRDRLLAHAGKMGCDSLVMLEPENIFYATGFWGEAVGLLEPGGRMSIIAPELEAGRAKEESRDCEIVTAGRRSDLLLALGRMAAGRAVCTDCRDYSSMVMLKKKIPKIKQSADPFYGARMVKDEGEIRILRKASRIIDRIFEECSQNMKAGQRESELQAILMSYAMHNEMFDTGYRSTLNPLIIAGGPNGALPHAQAASRRFRKGDLVVVDITLRHRSYVSDATRTFALGGISAAAREAYDIVRESQHAGLGAVRPGALCHDVDAACRDHIAERGHADHFIHSTGHGIGLEVHEPPAVSPKSDARLERNMAITVEPGIYIPKKFGIRIEDSLVVQDRPSVMHRFPKDLITV